jgi:hypothetical protein
MVKRARFAYLCAFAPSREAFSREDAKTPSSRKNYLFIFVMPQIHLDDREHGALWIAQNCKAAYVRNVSRRNILPAAQ